MTGEIHSIKKWARSAGKRDISLYSNFKLLEKVPKNSILMIGGVHGDEPEGVWLAESLLSHLKSACTSPVPWVLIPCINPDGIESGSRTNANGVDLNRNFPSQCWNDSHEKERYFPGSGPGSEPETQALVSLIKKLQPSVIIHFHSWKPMIVYSHPEALAVAKLFSDASGYLLKEDIGYPTPGSLGEYGAKDLDIGVVCIEEIENYPEKNKEEIFARFKQAFRELLKT